MADVSKISIVKFVEYFEIYLYAEPPTYQESIFIDVNDE